MRRGVQVVWFKRDLRVRDHRPLCEAAAAGPVVCLYLDEPALWAMEEFDASHLIFANQALGELDENLRRLGARLTRRRGEAVRVLEELAGEVGIERLWSHEETGNDVTYRRDVAVAAWCRARGVEWIEHRQDGVVRRLRSRDGWAARWERTMRRELLGEPVFAHGAVEVRSDGVVEPAEAGLEPSTKVWAQRGGESLARRVLDDFLRRRGFGYRSAMSSPVEGWSGCSRMSAYLAWGCVSMATVVREVDECAGELREARVAGVPIDKRRLASLKSFSSRLRWHCHFMQKLEDEPALEFRNMARVFDGLREEFTESAEGRERLAAWKEGLTGYPMIDACVRAVKATGWLNFRMRAMLASFAAHHLWLHWRPSAVFLGRHFLDFEPGIHFSQFQMQSGTTGINTVRIYSPAKQAADQDPRGDFIRMWVPELEGVPTAWIAQPHLMDGALQRRAGCVVGRDYPAPIVDHREAYRQARARIAEVRRGPAAREEGREILRRHGSRKRGGRPRGGAQGELFPAG